jgi:hypothetical protein
MPFVHYLCKEKKMDRCGWAAIQFLNPLWKHLARKKLQLSKKNGNKGICQRSRGLIFMSATTMVRKETEPRLSRVLLAQDMLTTHRKMRALDIFIC